MESPNENPINMLHDNYDHFILFRSKSGPFLGECVACQCNGKSNICDPETGVCAVSNTTKFVELHIFEFFRIGIYCDICFHVTILYRDIIWYLNSYKNIHQSYQEPICLVFYFFPKLRKILNLVK